MAVDHSYIEYQALNVIDTFNIKKPVVDVFTIAKESGYEIKEINMPEKFREVAGFYNSKDKTIYVNADDHPTKKIFTIAHELGHIFLSHKNYGVLYRIPRKSDDVIYQDQEKEANSFAANLLMPKFMIREYLEKYNLTINDYMIMANIFGVPMSSMKHFLEHLN